MVVVNSVAVVSGVGDAFFQRVQQAMTAYGRGYSYLAMVDTKHWQVISRICGAELKLTKLFLLDDMMMDRRVWAGAYVTIENQVLSFVPYGTKGCVSWFSVVEAVVGAGYYVSRSWSVMARSALIQPLSLDVDVARVSNVGDVSALLPDTVNTSLPRSRLIALSSGVWGEAVDQNRRTVTFDGPRLGVGEWVAFHFPVVPGLSEVQFHVPSSVLVLDFQGDRLQGLVTVGPELYYLRSWDAIDLSVTVQADLDTLRPRFLDSGVDPYVERDGFREGYCYLAMVMPCHRAAVASEHGEYPKLSRLLRLPVAKCVSLYDMQRLELLFSDSRLHVQLKAFRSVRGGYDFLSVCALLRGAMAYKCGTIGSVVRGEALDLTLDKSVLIGGLGAQHLRRHGTVDFYARAVQVPEKGATLSYTAIVAILEAVVIIVISITLYVVKCGGGRRSGKSRGQGGRGQGGWYG